MRRHRPLPLLTTIQRKSLDLSGGKSMITRSERGGGEGERGNYKLDYGVVSGECQGCKSWKENEDRRRVTDGSHQTC